jgi:hypothetical protein
MLEIARSAQQNHYRPVCCPCPLSLSAVPVCCPCLLSLSAVPVRCPCLLSLSATLHELIRELNEPVLVDCNVIRESYWTAPRHSNFMYTLTTMATVHEATCDSPLSIVVGKVPSRRYRVQMRKVHIRCTFAVNLTILETNRKYKYSTCVGRKCVYTVECIGPAYGLWLFIYCRVHRDCVSLVTVLKRESKTQKVKGQHNI